MLGSNWAEAGSGRLIVDGTQTPRIGREVGPLGLGGDRRPLRSGQVVLEQVEREAEPGGGGRDDAVQTELMGGEPDALARLPRACERVGVEPDRYGPHAQRGPGPGPRWALRLVCIGAATCEHRASAPMWRHDASGDTVHGREFGWQGGEFARADNYLEQ
jgi:hypothetical protein